MARGASSAAAAGPDVLFCLGATKAGTGWLYRYLSAHPECHLRTVKELHFFNADAPGQLKFQLRRLRARQAELSEAILAIEPVAGPEWRRADRQLRDVSALIEVQKSRRREDYLAYLTEGHMGRPIVADITPAYALLPEETLAEMSRLTRRVRFVYLMRDPVARLWSHVRMLAARATGRAGGVEAATAEIFDTVMAGGDPGVTDRGDYRAALKRFDRAIAPGQLHVAFFEELFSSQALARLCQFVGIAPVEGRYESRVHQGVSVEMREGQRARALTLLRPQYEYVAARMGRLPESWVASMAGEAG